MIREVFLGPPLFGSCRYKTGVDLPAQPPIEPMLARLAKALPMDDDLVFEPRWDGFRTQSSGLPKFLYATACDVFANCTWTSTRSPCRRITRARSGGSSSSPTKI